MAKVHYAVSDRGHPIGEAHHRAKLCDADVELIRDIYDEGMASHQILANVFGVSRHTINAIINFKKRATSPMGYRSAHPSDRRPVPKSRLMQLCLERGIDPPTEENYFYE